MSLLVSDVINDLQGETETVGQKITDSDFFLALNRANKYFMTNYKMPTTEREYELLVFPGVREYAQPSDFIGFIKPKKPYGLISDDFTHETVNEYMLYQHGKVTAFKFNRETGFLFIADDDESSAIIHDFDSITADGTWSVSGDGSGLAIDEQFFTQGSASLRFTVTGSGGTTTLVNSTFGSVDLSDYEDKAFNFLELICPSTNTANITSVRLRWGSDSSNYWEKTATTRHRGDSIAAGGGLIGFDWSNATEVGSPDSTAVDYVQIVITHPTTGVDGVYRIDNLFAANPTYYRLPYYSLYNIKSTGGTYQEKITADTDTILCPSDTNEAFTYKALELVAVLHLKDQSLASYAARELEPKEMNMKAKYPNQESPIQTTYFKRALEF